MRLFGKKKAESKFCPVCGTKLKSDDDYCVTCGYSFVARQKKSKPLRWKNIIIVLLIILALYLAGRYFNGLPMIPVSIADAFNFTMSSGK